MMTQTPPDTTEPERDDDAAEPRRPFLDRAKLGARLRAVMLMGLLMGVLQFCFFVLLLVVAVVARLFGKRPYRLVNRCAERSIHWLFAMEHRRLGFGTDVPLPVPTRMLRWKYFFPHFCLCLLFGLPYAGALLLPSGMIRIGRHLISGDGNTVVLVLLLLLGTTLLVQCLSMIGVGFVDFAVQMDRDLVKGVLAEASDAELNRRVEELAESRAGVVEAVHEERRRIERDLHDGVQQRLVAVGMLIGRARRRADAESRDDLMRQAHEQTQEALTELRKVAWRIYPADLDDGGLGTALETLAERTPIRVSLTCDIDREPSSIVATAAYFVVAEALTNAVKHGRASTVTISVSRDADDADLLRVRVVDDGVGGADPSGGGLSGLARRVAALDGTFQVVSPPAGPTTIVAELPCA
ncbi:sensor histidine kinase [Yinghuangia sp. YIM S10712]|uniref:sensor histidine kinase n=1 Tax=Yinghuangia sp. YIM S10712 TaxID=3436930 RepID=UPI003F53C8C3